MLHVWAPFLLQDHRDHDIDVCFPTTRGPHVVQSVRKVDTGWVLTASRPLAVSTTEAELLGVVVGTTGSSSRPGRRCCWALSCKARGPEGAGLGWHVTLSAVGPPSSGSF